MGVKRATKAAVNRALRGVGFELARVGASATTEDAFRRLQNTPVATIVDVGASDGRWSRDALRWFPSAACVLIEAQADVHRAGLEGFCEQEPLRRHMVLAAAGDRRGEIHFDGSDPLGGMASESATGEHDVVVPMTTVDHEVARLGVRGPFLLKLDTHGFELPILRGARTTLQEASLVIIEAYTFRLQPGSVRFHELVGEMEALGFRPAALADPLYRPSDGLLWQMDLFFIRADRPEFDRTRY